MDSFSAPSSGSSSQMSTEDFMDQLKTQLAQAYAEEFLEVLCVCVCVFRICLEISTCLSSLHYRWKTLNQFYGF